MPDELLIKAPAPKGSSKLTDRLDSLQAGLIAAYAVSLTLSITLSGVLLASGVFVFLLSQVAKIALDRQSPKLSDLPPLTLPLLAFSFAACLSGLANGGWGEVWHTVSSLRLFVVYFWAFTIFSHNRPLTFKSISALLIASSLAGLLAAIEQLFNFHPIGYKWLQGTGFLTAPMAFAGEMQVFFFLALGFLYAKSYRTLNYGIKYGITYTGIVAFNSFGLLFAAERSAWLGGLVAALAQAAFVSRKLLAKSLIILITLSAFSWFFVPVVQQRLDPLMNWQHDVSTRVRFYLWGQAYGLWQKSPAFGVGLCRFPRFEIEEAIVPGRSKDLNHAHSNYWQILATTGLVGFAAYMYLHISALLLAFRVFVSDFAHDERREKALALGILGGLVALMISGIFEYNFGTSQVRQAQWLTLGMLIRPPKNKKG
jgi:O-antigen ligase